MPRVASVDWETIEREYITTDETYLSLSELHDISFESVKHRGVSGNWVAKRKAWQHLCLKKGLQLDAKKKASAISEFQKTQIAAIDALVGELDEVIQELTDARTDASLTLTRRISLIHHVAQAQAAIVKTSHLLTGEATEITKSVDTYRELLKDCGIRPNEMSGAQCDGSDADTESGHEDSTTGAAEALDGQGSS